MDEKILVLEPFFNFGFPLLVLNWLIIGERKLRVVGMSQQVVQINPYDIFIEGYRTLMLPILSKGVVFNELFE